MPSITSSIKLTINHPYHIVKGTHKFKGFFLPNKNWILFALSDRLDDSSEY